MEMKIIRCRFFILKNVKLFHETLMPNKTVDHLRRLTFFFSANPRTAHLSSECQENYGREHACHCHDLLPVKRHLRDKSKYFSEFIFI